MVLSHYAVGSQIAGRRGTTDHTSAYHYLHCARKALEYQGPRGNAPLVRCEDIMSCVGIYAPATSWWECGVQALLRWLSA